MPKPPMPSSLGGGGKKLWRAMASDEMPEHLVALLTEACRARDRLDRFDKVLRGEAETWMRLTHRTQTNDYELKIDGALSGANSTAALFKNLLEKIPAPAVSPKGATGGTNSNSGATPIDKARSRRAAGGGAKPSRTRTAERRRRPAE